MKRLKGINILLTGLVSILILLWVYTASSKLTEYENFQKQLYNQTFNPDLAEILVWLIPAIEITTAILLAFSKTRLTGLVFSVLLMGIFTTYILLVLTDYYERTPCSCGGVLKEMGWQTHFWFNIFFLSIAILGTFLQLKLLKIKKGGLIN